jgi:DNA-directed RNA polymerase subunit N
MIIPVRCHTCGKVLCDKYNVYLNKMKEGKKDPKEIFEELGIKRYCCKTILTSHINIIDNII